MFDVENGQQLNVKLSDGDYLRPVVIKRVQDRLWLNIGFAKKLRLELKNVLDGMRYHGYEDPPIKAWSCKYSEHNLFRLAYMMNLNPYELYERPLSKMGSKFPLRGHQFEMQDQWWTRHFVIWGAEMGLGKSLAALSTCEHICAKYPDITWENPILWVSVKSAIVSVKLEYAKWGSTLPIRFMTYDGLKKHIENIKAGTPAPRVIIGDESHKLKNFTTQRTQSFAYTTECMRREYGNECYVVLMTGTPMPKSPLDWYAQCEIVCPGFLKEGNVHLFKQRLAVVEKKESSTGGIYPELASWRDNTDKCDICGRFADALEHDVTNEDRHDWVKSKNEVEFLYKRMKDLVLIKTKAECTDLPEKQYKRIYCKPRASTLRAMKMIATVQTSTIKVLTLCRELSDGFQYLMEENGKKKCELCFGSGTHILPLYNGPEKTEDFVRTLANAKGNDYEIDCPEDYIIDPVEYPQWFEMAETTCPNCLGECVVPNMIQSYRDTKTAKDAALIDIIADHEEVGRLVVYAGFTASVDRICELVKDQEDWDYIRVDGRGWATSLEFDNKWKPEDLIKFFQDKSHDKKIIFIGNPGSAGTGLTLTASPTIVYYSNDFNADSRQQSEDRIHRLGMDANRGALIIDLIHLPTDEYVLDNLLKKKRLQNLTMGQLTEAMEKELERADYTEEAMSI